MLVRSITTETISTGNTLTLTNCIINALSGYITINLTSTQAQWGRFPSEFVPFPLLVIIPLLLIIVCFLPLHFVTALTGEEFITSTAFYLLKQRCAANITTT